MTAWKKRVAKAKTHKQVAGGTVGSLDRIFNLKTLMATAAGACWCSIGAALLVFINEFSRKHLVGLAVFDIKTAATVGAATGGGIYGILSRTSWGIRRCLLRSHALFVDGLINKGQYTSMQNKCLERWN
jgi:hypothetical protein